MVITYSRSVDQPGKVSNPALDQLNRDCYCNVMIPLYGVDSRNV